MTQGEGMERTMKTVWIAAVLAAAAPPARAASWPMFRVDNARTGDAGEQAAPPLTARWEARIEGAGVGSPVVAAGRVYAPSRAGFLYCFDAFTGAELWNFSAGHWIDSTPAVADGRVVFASRDGSVYALNAADGTLLWSYTTDSADVSSPLIVSGEIVVSLGVPNKKVLVLDAATGALLREGTLSAFSQASPVLDAGNDLLFVGAGDGSLSAFRFSTLGSALWKFQSAGGIFLHTPTLNAGKVLVIPGDDDRKLYALDASASGPTTAWSSAALCATAAPVSSIAAEGTTAYLSLGCSGAHKVYARNLADGSAAWTSASLGAVGTLGFLSTPALTDGYLYVASQSGNLYALTRASGAVVGTYALGAGAVASPAVANGWVYVSTLDGRLLGFEAAKVAAIAAPDFRTTPEVSGQIAFQGYVKNPDLQSYSVEVGTGADPAAWTLLAAGTAAVSGGTLAQWNATQVEDGLYSVRLSALENSGALTRSKALFRVVQIQTATIAAGAASTINLADGTELQVPAGAFASSATVRIQRLFSGYVNSGIDAGIRATDQVRRITVDGVDRPTFTVPLILKFPWAAAVPQPAKPQNLRIYYYDTASLQWRVVKDSEVDLAAGKVVVKLHHLTDFRLMEFVPSDVLLQTTKVYTYPNPATGGSVNFKVYLGQAADIRIKVYDVAGTQVAALEKTGNPAGQAAELTWDISNTASGIYVYRLEAVSGSKTERVTKKLAVLH